MDQKFKDWLATKPESIQKLATKYPPGEYMVKPGAPYGVSCEGTVVSLFSYCEDGTVSVVVLAKNKLPKAIEHEKELGRQYNKTDAEMEFIHKNNVQVIIDPEWLFLISNEL